MPWTFAGGRVARPDSSTSLNGAADIATTTALKASHSSGVTGAFAVLGSAFLTNGPG
jgi:hypothetical protein